MYVHICMNVRKQIYSMCWLERGEGVDSARIFAQTAKGNKI